ncbi:MAG TPA: LLM class flavin-dependent oxidoreductase [Candidatus Acidoferrales bacterium]|nr:LLM class flavin-dependent oxidoreductase [Candidatus Acidoferrales bacterium]
MTRPEPGIPVGVFDHLDRGALPLNEFYEARLKLIEAYDRLGFDTYHVAEHHSTPLGMAPAPSVFLSAVAQRTRRLRFGPLVYALPLHHPLRLIEEICMLDQLSGGRLQIGFGRGSSANEIAIYGQNPADAQRIYAEALDLILQGLSQKTLTFKGYFFSFDNVPIEIEPLQKPHPPVWYGVHSVQSAETCARRGFNVVSLDTARETRAYADRYREVWGDKPLPKIGISRFIVIAENDGEALAAARRAYKVWRRSFYYLYELRGGAPAHERPRDFDGQIETGQGIAGAPAAVAKFLRAQLAESQANYLVGQFAFGDLRFDECLRSVELFAREVVPALRLDDGERRA